MGVGRTDPLFDGGGETGRAMAVRDWTLTPLGPPEGWPASLRSAVRILLTSRFAMWMGWGPELTFFYNDAYRRDTLRAKHPWALGQPARAVWAEIWDDIGPRIASVLESGAATWDEDLLLFLERSGYPEETYHTFSYSPLSDDGGTVAGMLCVVAEDTDRVLSERRMSTLRELATELATGHTEHEVLDALRHRLAANPRDLPFAMAYLFDGAGDAALAVATGAAPGDPVAPRTGAGAWPVAELLAGRTVLVEGLRERFAPLPAGAWPEPPTQAVAVPLAQPGSDRPSGFLVAGLNPFRPYDERYRGFVELLANQVATGLGNARAYEAERHRAEALAELDRAKTEFFTGISHEFRTPLTLIMGPLGELRAAPAIEADPRLRTELDVVHRNGLRLEKLVNELLDFSRLQAGRMRARFEPVDLPALTAELASVFRSAMQRAGLGYEVDCPPLDEPVWVDRGMWEKVVLNLLSNAVKFTFDGAVAVAVRRHGDRVQLTVSDSGTGIPAVELPHLFERFHRVPQARSRSGEGSGIGLATVRELVALHGGTIEAASTPGVGSTFTVTLRTGREHLPTDQVMPGPAPAVSSAVSAAAEPFLAEALRWLSDGPGVPGAPAPHPASTARVLVADDNVDMREYVRRLLADRYTVHTAADGDAALAAALTDPPDLVVSDVMMPGLDGMALVAALRDDQRTANVPVLLLSARAGQEAAVEGLAAGADDYLVKPFTAVELLARVDGHVELGRARRRERERQRALAAVGAAMDREPGLPARRAALVRALVDEGLVDVARLIDDQTRVVATAGPDRATERLLAELRGDPPLARRVLATGEPAVAEVDEDYVLASSADPAQQELRRRLDMRSVVFVPLVARGRVGGLLATARIGGSAPQTEDDLALLAEIGERAAVALDNAQLYDREQLTSRRLAVLQRATAALSAAATPVQVAQVGAAEFERLLGSSASGVWELHADALEAVAERGWTEQMAADWEIIHLDTRIMATDAIRQREPVWTGTRDDWDRDYPQMRELIARYGYASAGALPLLAGGRCLGVVVVVFAEERVADTAERAAAVALADQCAQAFQRAALLATESAARQTAEEIGEVVTALSGATTPGEVTDVIFQHAALLGAEATAVLLREGDHVEVVAARGPARSEQQLRLDAAHPVAYAVRTGHAVWHATRSAVAWPAQRFSTTGVDLPAQVVLPLLLGGRAIGAIALGFAEPPVFTAEQRTKVLTVAGQCAQALDRARLHQAEHEIADVLQRSLLPRELPRLERLGVAARYLPGAAGSQTGGDWYDLLPLHDGCTALVVGDVVGQGPAAAAVMGQLRSALAGYLLEGHPPAAALELLDAFAARVPGAQGSTCACVTVDWAAGELRWARAGHPPALFVDADGARFLDGATGTVLGVTGRPPYTDVGVRVTPGASVVLYTDGLVERRGEVLDDGLERLRKGAVAHAGDGPERLVTALLAAGLDEGAAHDDVAVIAARLMPAPQRDRLPARADTLSSLRRAVQAWGRDAGLDGDQLDDLQLALGEAAANAVEHAYPAGGPDGEKAEFEYTLGRLADGAVAVSVRDFGTWRPPPDDAGYRGRGIAMVQAIAATATVEPGPTGTEVRFALAPPIAPLPEPAADHRPAPGRPARLVTEAGRIVLHGDIDLPAAAELRTALLAAVASADGAPVVLDLDGVTYLASAGVGLVLELADRARDAGVELDLRAAPGSVAARVLGMAGLAADPG